MGLVAGQALAHYRLLKRIGRSRAREVWLAEDVMLNRRVVLQALAAADVADRVERLARRRAMEAAAALRHPNIVAVYSVEQDQGVPFVTMERVEGPTLAEIVPARGFSAVRLLEYAVPLVDALAAAHERGIHHRNLEAGRVRLTPAGRLKVLGLGLTDRTDRAAPADVVALGIVLHLLATGRQPAGGRAELTALPRGLAAIVARCLDPEPAARYPSAKELGADLERWKLEVVGLVPRNEPAGTCQG